MENDFIVDLKNKICKIESSKYNFAYGFFYEIPFQNHSLKVLVTNNYILSLEFFYNHNEIKLEVNSEKKILPINNKRKIWTNEDMNYTIVEILEADQINSFFTFEEKMNTENLIKESKDLIFPILNENQDISIEKRKIEPISCDSFYFHDNCNINYNSSGEPYITPDNYCIIGIHIIMIKKIKIMKKILEFL